ncbi:cation-transporting P-type ATPase [Kaistia dalseonensis]|uniref:Magnesium-transporting ATPase (P-type) n=1 Tax=Kaistia dalseonensis TaxID=410840 RepID=A0ABU0H284_9HYPH|nr:cation-transporting P-type ATPase [Kaistia dalseonensis]MCX5493850.1 cation-transporting P-type ATPase [Kaistia dalseonensis]MDQ0436415.1 magnesium-transporting ATPase (P-type) [Kaistia dalseonensis]
MTSNRQPTPRVDPYPVADDWHAHPPQDVARRLHVTEAGLTSSEAEERLRRHGPNALPQAVQQHPLLRFLAQFDSTIIYFLLAGALAALLLGHHVDAAVIVAVVLINAIVGFVQEGKAEEALSAIRNMISPRANVIRDGRRSSVTAENLVPGDLVLLEAGDRVPADLRLNRARNLHIDEAALTGESVASEKNEDPVRPDAPLGDRHSMAFSGTMVSTGQGSGLVVATGTHTEIGRIGRMLSSIEPLATPLLRQINEFGRRFTWTAIIASVLLFAFAVLLRDYGWTEALMVVVALAVGVVPEGLPAVITITLAIGVRRMARRNAIVRRLPAVETLGATSVICSDKTGTLTRNEMTARRLITPEADFSVDGAGYAPAGAIRRIGDAESPSHAIGDDALMLVRSGLLCNDAHLHDTDGHWRVEGDPMEGALITLAMKAGLDSLALRSEWPRLDEIPFDAAHRFMATLHRDPEGRSIIIVKGAPERVLAMCGIDATEHATGEAGRWLERISAAASQGERLLGFATKRVDVPATHQLSFADLDGGLNLVGLVSFIDPPRAEAIAAIAECHSAGIAVKMITGDHGATAGAIARQLNLADNPTVVTGAMLDTLSDADLIPLAERTSVFARTSPEHKLRIVRALQSSGAVVAMTGDGVNDAPSLRQADVGIAMGRKGTEAAKEASEIVLLDDNFASIVAAVQEGRTVYDNIRKMIAWTLPTNGGEVLAVIAAIIVGFTMPMSPVQILWINLLLTITLGLVLAFEPSEPGVMSRPPRRSDAALLTPFMLWRIGFVSVLFLGASLAMFSYAFWRGYDLATARTIVVNTIVVLEIFYLFNVRYLHMTSITWRGVLGTPAVLLAVSIVVLAQLAFTYLPIMNQIFDTRPIALLDGVVIIAVGVVLMVILETEKALLRRFDLLGQSRSSLRQGETNLGSVKP